MSKFTVTASPHIFAKDDVPAIMKRVLLALTPSILASLYFFRMMAFWLYVVCIVSAVAGEFLLQKAMGKKVTVNDFSAVITAVLLAMVLPPNIPLWMAALGSFIAVSLGKQVFGGLGYNIFNPALLARAFLMAAFPIHLTSWTRPFTLDAVTTATPLGMAKFAHTLVDYKSLFIGNVSGSLGETSAAALLLGGIFLLATKTIDFRIPGAYILTVFIFGQATHFFNPQYPPGMFHLLAGGLMIGAFFMATDFVTTPITKKGRIIFGIGCGVITTVIRLWGGLPEGVMYSILLMNSVTPLINRWTRPKRYGV